MGTTLKENNLLLEEQILSFKSSTHFVMIELIPIEMGRKKSDGRVASLEGVSIYL